MEKSVFEARDPNPNFSYCADKEKYVGPERRRMTRRSLQERRSAIRFDLGKTSRRENPGGRRSDDALVNFV